MHILIVRKQRITLYSVCVSLCYALSFSRVISRTAIWRSNNNAFFLGKRIFYLIYSVFVTIGCGYICVMSADSIFCDLPLSEHVAIAFRPLEPLGWSIDDLKVSLTHVNRHIVTVNDI